MNLADRAYWIFDMDGTLTVPAHDFDAIRDELGLAQGRPILEQLADLPEKQAGELRRRLEAIELEIARRARRQPGSRELLTKLHARGTTLGILTRNSHGNALETLETCGLMEFFEPGNVMAREMCDPKPSADGIRKLLARWNASPDEAVMVGDFLFDILAGREAGTATIYVHNLGKDDYSAHADMSVPSLENLVPVDNKRDGSGSNLEKETIMSAHKVDFTLLSWEVPMAGVRLKAKREGGKQLRLVEYTPEMPPHWCEVGHCGYVLEGRFEIQYDDETVVYEPGDGVFIPSGHEHRHMGRALTDVVKVFFVEDI